MTGRIVIVFASAALLGACRKQSRPAVREQPDAVGETCSRVFSKTIELDPKRLAAVLTVDRHLDIAQLEFIDPTSGRHVGVDYVFGNIAWPARRDDPHVVALTPLPGQRDHRIIVVRSLPSVRMSTWKPPAVKDGAVPPLEQSKGLKGNSELSKFPKTDRPRVTISCKIGRRHYKCRLHWRGDVFWFDRGAE